MITIEHNRRSIHDLSYAEVMVILLKAGVVVKQCQGSIALTKEADKALQKAGVVLSK